MYIASNCGKDDNKNNENINCNINYLLFFAIEPQTLSDIAKFYKY